MLGMPAPTPFDLNFRLLGIPVRVSPWFWLGTVILGGPQPGAWTPLLIWVACVFGSILLHELGHGLTARSFGYRPEIALHGMGGLCASEAERQTPGQRLAVLIMGPGSQLILLALIVAVAWIGYGIAWRGNLALAKILFGFDPPRDQATFRELAGVGRMGATGSSFYFDLFQINLLWPLLNLLPIFPLDGGQIALVLMSKADPRHGARRSHIVSMVLAGILAAYVLSRPRDPGDNNGFLIALFFASFAFMNYQYLQVYHRRYVEYGPEDADWWKR